MKLGALGAGTQRGQRPKDALVKVKKTIFGHVVVKNAHLTCWSLAKLKWIFELAHITFVHNLHQYCILKLNKTSLDSFYTELNSERNQFAITLLLFI